MVVIGPLLVTKISLIIFREALQRLGEISGVLGRSFLGFRVPSLCNYVHPVSDFFTSPDVLHSESQSPSPINPTPNTQDFVSVTKISYWKPGTLNPNPENPKAFQDKP